MEKTGSIKQVHLHYFFSFNILYLDNSKYHLKHIINIKISDVFYIPLFAVLEISVYFTHIAHQD